MAIFDMKVPQESSLVSGRTGCEREVKKGWFDSSTFEK